MHVPTIQGSIGLVDIDTGYEEATYMMADGADNLDKGIYKAMTMLIKSFVQTTFMISDDNDDDPQASPAPTTKPAKFTNTQAKRDQAKQTVKENKVASMELINQCLDLIESIRTVEADFGHTVEKAMRETDDKGNHTVLKTVATNYLMRLEAKAVELGVI